jgi:hypothetical protein
MHEAEGDLLIGGDRIKRLHIDLEAEQKQDGSRLNGRSPGICM